MPLHDWTRVDAGLFHAFRFHWISTIADALNERVLPSDHFALIEKRRQSAGIDALTLKLATDTEKPSGGGLAVAEVPPQTSVIRRSEDSLYASQANRITVRHRHGDVVAVIEIVSPGNKGSKSELAAFVRKTVELIRQDVHLLVIDLFPPTRRDPQGIHKAIWDEFQEEEFNLPVEKPLILASYDAGPPQVAYVEPIGIGDILPEMPLFLRPEIYVPAPLESTYQTTWSVFPRALKHLLE